MYAAGSWTHWFPLHMVWHVVVASLLGWGVAKRTGRASAGWACAAISLFIDLDHVVDYLRYYGWRHVSWRDFVNARYVWESGRVYLFGHAWEWVALLWWVSRWMPQRERAMAMALAVGLAGHLVVDTIDHHEYLGKNLLTYRLAHHFAASAIITQTTQQAIWGEVRWLPDHVRDAAPLRHHHARTTAQLPLTTVTAAEQ